MECGSISRDPASQSLGPVWPKLDFPRSIFGGKSVRFQEKWYDLCDWIEY